MTSAPDITKGQGPAPLIPVEDLIARVRSYNPQCAAGLIRDAYAFGEKMHEGQLRQSGEPYFSHPVAVAMILAEQQMDDATIITALLHDTIEDTKASYPMVAERFGTVIADLVDGVTKLTNLQLSSTETKQAENFRKLFMATSKDLRVTLVKLADRLHNMRTIKSMRAEKQAQKARETMDIFAPLAGRMGMQWMREELEDLAFKVLNPEARNSIIRRFLTLQRETGDVIERITTDMRGEFAKAGISAEVIGRAKKPYSIWRKMQEKELGILPPLRHLRLSDHHRDRGRMLPRAGRDPPALAGRAGPVQGLHQPAQDQRLPLDPYDGVGPRRQARRGADPHPRDA
jgi:GTP diphosphokinase / guanosine-3',5'-bis(diphosphate) 3'-diphosphatase